MINSGNTGTGTVINCENGYRIIIWPETILTATIRVEKDRKCLWQKTNQTACDLIIALNIAYNEVQTNIFETI